MDITPSCRWSNASLPAPHRRHPLLDELLVDVTPEPALAGLGGRDYRVAAGVEVLRGVLILGGVAAADVSAGEAGAEVHPRISHGDTLCAEVCFGRDVMAVGKMFADSQRALLRSDMRRLSRKALP